jgi:hypothetical protein
MKNTPAPRARQQGIVLLIALIALVALSLSGIMLMRSVDTSNVVTGNFAFNEAATQMAEVGVAAAETLISGNLYSNTNARQVNNCNAAGPSLPTATATATATLASPITNKGDVGKANNCPHFYSIYFTDIDPVTNLPRNFPAGGWSPSISLPTMPDYNVQYFVERMCTQETWKWDVSIAPAASAVAPVATGTNAWLPGAPTFKACLATPVFDMAGVPVPNKGRLFYRITVQVNGPRNTRSVVQYYVGMEDVVLSTAP